MQLPGLVTVQPEQTELIDKLADMMGEAFLEELWTAKWLEALEPLGVGRDRKFEISRAVMKCDFTMAAPYGACLMLPDMAAGVGCYMRSELQGQSWAELDEKSSALLAKEVLSAEEKQLLDKQVQKMVPITNFDLVSSVPAGEDFMHIFSIGVNPHMRGTGAFRRLMTPLLDHADSRGINFYLECYTDHLEGLYGHFGFKTVEVYKDPAFDIRERVMVRTPR